jgi:hypothetical protein
MRSANIEFLIFQRASGLRLGWNEEHQAESGELSEMKWSRKSKVAKGARVCRTECGKGKNVTEKELFRGFPSEFR